MSPPRAARSGARKRRPVVEVRLVLSVEADRRLARKLSSLGEGFRAGRGVCSLTIASRDPAEVVSRARRVAEMMNDGRKALSSHGRAGETIEPT